MVDAMRVLMIGGTALTGPHVIRQLLARRGVRLFVLSRRGKRVLAETAVRGDRRNPAALAAALDQARPDVVIDMVPFTAGDATGLVAALDATGYRGPVVACSSCDVYAAYGRIHGTETAPRQAWPITEDMALRRVHGPEGAAYDKTAVERILRAGLGDVTVLRLPAIYGWPDRSRVAQYLDAMLDGADRITVPAHRFDFRFSRALHKNVAHGVVLAALAGQTGQHIYNLAEPEAPTESGWARRIARGCGWRGEIVAAEGDRAVDQHLAMSSAKIRRELAYSEIADPDEGLADAIAFHSFSRRGGTYAKAY